MWVTLKLHYFAFFVYCLEARRLKQFNTTQPNYKPKFVNHQPQLSDCNMYAGLIHTQNNISLKKCV